MILAITKVMVDFPASLEVPNIDMFFSLEPFVFSLCMIRSLFY